MNFINIYLYNFEKNQMDKYHICICVVFNFSSKASLLIILQSRVELNAQNGWTAKWMHWMNVHSNDTVSRDGYKRV